jgi:hypothetical protein
MNMNMMAAGVAGVAGPGGVGVGMGVGGGVGMAVGLGVGGVATSHDEWHVTHSHMPVGIHRFFFKKK